MRRTRCEKCKQLKEQKGMMDDGRRVVDPFRKEIFNETAKIRVCKDCYQELCWDI